MIMERTTPHAVESRSLADLLERILDKGIVIAGDIRINLVNVELLSIHLRLVICSMDKAKEMGIDWWANQPVLGPTPAVSGASDRFSELERRLKSLERNRPRAKARSRRR